LLSACISPQTKAEHKAASCKLQAASCKLQAASCKLQAASCKLQAASCKLQAASCKLQAGDGDGPAVPVKQQRRFRMQDSGYRDGAVRILWGRTTLTAPGHDAERGANRIASTAPLYPAS
jgi:hypothetical protein